VNTRNPRKRSGDADDGVRYRTALPINQITPAAIQARLSYRLRRLIGPGKRMTLAEAASATGIGERTLKAYVEGTACPNLARYGRLLRVFGPEVGIELASMIGWEPRASNARLPHIEDLRALRDVVAEAVRAVDTVMSHAGSGSEDGEVTATAPWPRAAGRPAAARR
jgi:hypothetical protein